jgi:FKBP-type peptidyl-prolyl cis-trans isomerase 2
LPTPSENPAEVILPSQSGQISPISRFSSSRNLIALSLLVAIVLLLAACGGNNSGGGRVAQDGDRVAVHYHGTLDSGEVFDSSRERDPLEFVVGGGQVISGFDSAVRGLGIGESRTVRMEAADAYGEHDEELVFEFPKDQAPEGLEEGDQVQFANGAPGLVVEVTNDIVKIDANHPLAGQALTFDIELVSIE